MGRNLFLQTGLIALLAVSMAAPAFAMGPGGFGKSLIESKTVRLLVERRSSIGPKAFRVFCKSSPRDCRGGGASKTALGKTTFKKLARINRAVNRAIKPKTDIRDIWSINVSQGDCEDYVLTKRRKLIAMGIPASSLRIAVGTTKRGVGHAVLIIRSTSGDLVLDNRNNSIRPWYKTDIKFLAMTSSNAKTWRYLR
ncbi:MAG: transglutaminase-like cysteine peptidase [Cohaesibacteraceae bacterium]|nr:transglutaminase-like cysteine peptidase [Cohaesibacteraceae bacterium]